MSEFSEPKPTEEDRRRNAERLERLMREREEASKAGELLPPVPEGLWNTED